MISDAPYRCTIRPLPEDEGGGCLIEFPDLPGCMSDGATVEEAIMGGLDAMRSWTLAMRAEDYPIPAPDPLRGGVTCWATKTMPCQLVATGGVLVSGVERLADSAACVCSRRS